MEKSDLYSCTICKDDKPLDDMDRVSKKNTGRCKVCKSDYVNNLAKIKRVAKHPERYSDCNSCDNTFYAFTSNAEGNYTKRLKVLACPKCGSGNIESCA